MCLGVAHDTTKTQLKGNLKKEAAKATEIPKNLDLQASVSCTLNDPRRGSVSLQPSDIPEPESDLLP